MSSLKAPWNDELDFNVTLSYFLVAFDISDKADAWNEELCKIDVSDADALSKLFVEHLLPQWTKPQLLPTIARQRFPDDF